MRREAQRRWAGRGRCAPAAGCVAVAGCVLVAGWLAAGCAGESSRVRAPAAGEGGSGGATPGAADEAERYVELEGEVHAAVPAASLYVFTVRDPHDFFTSTQYVLYAVDPDVAQHLEKLRRHDRVALAGHQQPNPTGQAHIRVARLERLKRWDPGEAYPTYEHQTRLPHDLPEAGVLIGKVHAVAGEGRIVVLEYRDAVLPLVSDRLDLTRDLSRNDKVRVHFSLRRAPSRPTHLAFGRHEPPLEVLEAIADAHQTVKSVFAPLVKFPSSPQITIDVYGALVEDDDGVSRIFTLVNFEDPAAFDAIRLKLAAGWRQGASSITRGRNYLVNRRLRVRATGRVNQVSRNQANPQLLLAGPSSLHLVAVP